MTLPPWLNASAAKIIAALALLAIMVTVLLLHECSTERTVHTETRLATGQASASLASGADAVDATGTVEGNSIAADAITRENDDAIRNAAGAAAPVDPAVRDAGLAGLCRRASYRGDPKCVQFAAPR